MRIVQLGPMPPPHGGVSANMLAIHDTLLRLGHDSRIIDVTNRENETPAEGVLKPRSAFALIKMLLAIDCELVHYHIGGDFNLKLAFLTLLCGLLPRKKSVITFHSGGYAREAVGFAKPFSIRGIALRSIDLLIGVNDQMLEMFQSFGIPKGRMRLILPFDLKRPNPSVALPADLEAFAKNFKPLLLSVGALEPEYGNEFIIGSMMQIVEQFPDAGLMIVGSGSMESELRKVAAASGLDDRIMMPGNLEPAFVLGLIDRAHTLLRLTDYDGDSVAVREALFLGTPVIASDNVIRPRGVFLLTSPFRPDELVQKLIQVQEAQLSGPVPETGCVKNSEKIVEAYRELLAS